MIIVMENVRNARQREKPWTAFIPASPSTLWHIRLVCARNFLAVLPAIAKGSGPTTMVRVITCNLSRWFTFSPSVSDTRH